MFPSLRQGFTSAFVALGFVAIAANAGINAWTTTGPKGGWTFLAADPTTPGRVFTGREGALYRSTDDTQTWARIDVAADPSVPSLRPISMAWDPAARNTVYASFGGRRLAKSIDGGATWAPLGAEVPCCPGIAIGFDRIAVVAGSARRLHVLVNGGSFFTSSDDGATWGANTSGPGTDFVIDPFRPDSIYFATVAGGRFARSDDGGASWQSFDTGIDPGLHFSALAADPVQKDRVYAVGDIFGSPNPAALYLSNDRGVTWRKLGVLPDDAPSLVSQLQVDTARPNVLVALSRTNVLRSDDGGISWRVLDVRPSPQYGLGGGRSTALATATNVDTLYVSSSTGGIARTVDGGATWEPRNAGLPGDRVTALAGATNPIFGKAAIARRVWFGASTLYLGAGAWNLWEDAFALPSGVAPPFSFALSAVVATSQAVSAPVPTWFVLGDTDRVARSNLGSDWQELTPLPEANYDQLAATSAVPAVLYAAGTTVHGNSTQTPGGLAVSLDGGQTWLDRRNAFATAAGGSLDANALDITALAVDPQRPATVWIGVGPGLWRSDDSGATWTRIAYLSTEVNSPQRIDAIAVDPADSGHVVVAGHLGARVRESLDGGATWTLLEDGLTYPGEVRALAVDWIAQPRAIYVGTARGVYVNTAPAHWSLIPGSETLAVNALVIARPPGVTDRMTILAGTDTGVHEYTADPAAQFVAVYRFFNTATSTHFYTSSAVERDYVLAHYPTFQDEGTAFWALKDPAPRGRPVWRFFNTVTGTHFYTNSAQERDIVLAKYPQFVLEGIVYYVFDDSEPGTVPVWRFYNTASGMHFYTTSDDEVVYVEQRFPQFAPEGRRYGVYPAVPRQ